VRGGLDQVDKIFGAVPTPDRSKLAGCNNPTFQNGKNTLLATAPYPTRCDKLGSPLYGCTTAVSGQQHDGSSSSSSGGSNSGHSGSNSGTGSTSGSGSGTGSGTGTGSGAGAGSGSSNGSSGSGGVARIDPVTGRPISATVGDAGGSSGSGNSNGAVYIPPQAVPVSSAHNQRVLWSGLSAAAILAAVLVPPFLGLWLRRRQKVPTP
jgi:hypothetical protein